MEMILLLVVVLLGPLVALVLLPVLPTVWIGVIFPIASHFLKKCGVTSFYKRVCFFYLFTAVTLSPMAFTIKETIESPQALFGAMNTTGFRALTIYTITVTLFHKRLSALLEKAKTKLFPKK
ncbi:MAG: hypothetical protein WCW90_02485 [Candidatus Paceibacterota bacterium]|jgi:hypothetical protein